MLFSILSEILLVAVYNIQYTVILTLIVLLLSILHLLLTNTGVDNDYVNKEVETSTNNVREGTVF